MNFHLLLIQLIALCICSCIPKTECLTGNNVQYVKSKDLNFVAALAYVDKYKIRVFNVFCSGVLINEQHVITNEHCIRYKKPEDAVAYLGSFDLNEAQEFKICDWISYTDWLGTKVSEPKSLEFDDIAIIQLCDSVDTKIISPAKPLWTTYNYLQEKTGVTMAGWGLVEHDFASQYMRKATLNVVDQSRCEQQTQMRSIAVGRYFCTKVKPYVVGSGGDSGGPLLIGKNDLVGITAMRHTEHKKFSTTVNLHANLTYYKEFIQDYTNDYYSVLIQ
ncbi:hypothetical protein QAD02_006151 [Eretmocerus hayati]|uniref:Uncharacterized protein n=1 Tax=Eretmocerus hayati TaxID=131215 RepID=A0ACC2N2G9_9HYME|nr:hypothetical protein QAD02_006151 [Eretmocerus hayati]